MTTANFEETPPPETPRRGFRRPADYYSSASPERAFPPAVSLGCGGAALLALIAIFAGGAWMRAGGFLKLIDFSMGMTLGDVRGRYSTDVSEADKKRFESEVEAMRENLRQERAAIAHVQPFLDTLRTSISDGTVSPKELQQMTAQAEKVNRTAKARAKPAAKS